MDILNIVKDAIAENPELTNDQLVEKLKASDSDVLFTTKKENETHIANQVKNQIQTEVNNAFSNLHGKSEKAISEATGLTKPENIKGYDWYAQLIKDQLGTIKGLNSKLDTTLSGDEVAKQQVLTLQKQLEEANGLVEKEKLNVELFKKGTFLNTAFGSLKFDESHDADLIGLKKQAVQDALINKAEFRDGKLVFKGEDGNIMLNAANASNPYTAEELVSEQMSKYLYKEQTARGLNGQPKNKATTSSSPVGTYIASKAPKNKDEFYAAGLEWAQLNKVSNVDKDFNKSLNEAKDQYKFD
jgi:hypothetical protein